MTQEEKELLLKDLCGRLPYGVKVYDTKGNFDSNCQTLVHINGPMCEAFVVSGFICRTAPITDLKPYLFPLSSMTEEQYKEMQDIVGNPNDACIMIKKVLGLELWLNSVDTDPTIWLSTLFDVQDWLNKNHFDYRGFIEKGLAIDATGLNIY